MKKLELFTLLLLYYYIYITTVAGSGLGDEGREEGQRQQRPRPSMISRVRAHDFCVLGDRAEFRLDEEDVLPPDTFFLPCHSLDDHWVDCEPLTVPKLVNGTKVYPCPHFGTSKEGRLHFVNVTCRVLPCIECHGPREFKRSFPCKKYTGYYFLSALLYSLFLGLFAVDRFYLGYSAIAVGKLMTLGGLGIWWVVDVFLLLNGQLHPADGSEWQPFWQ